MARAVAAACADDLGAVTVTVGFVEPSLRVGVDRDLVERILHSVVGNACRYTRSFVSLSVFRDGASVAFAVDDDGPGVTQEESEAISESAMRGTAGQQGPPGAGLGLALARRLARTVSGDVTAVPAGTGRFVVRLPAG